MAITSIDRIELDSDEYSQYERDKDTITVTIYGQPAQPSNGDALTVELRKSRRNRDVAIATGTYTFDGAFAAWTTTGVTVTFVLPNVLSSPDLLRLAREGEYFIHVEDVADEDTSLDSSDFDISIVSVDRFKRDFLFGLDLQAAEVRTWKMDPKQITGVKLVQISRQHPAAFFPLNFRTDGTSNYLSWAEGPEIKVNTTSRERFILPSSLGQDYVIVDVDGKDLPSADYSELILVEEDEITDETLRRHLRQARDLIENTELQIFLEPTRCVTDIDPTQITFSQQNLSPIVLDADWDVRTPPVTFYPKGVGDWIHIQMPMFHVLRVDSLYGAVANTRIVDINLEWIEIGEKQGFLQLVPFNQEIAFDFIGLVYVEALRGQVEIPSFWRYNLIAGLRDVPAEIQEYLGRLAAIPVLTVAGQAFRSGYSSQSVSRDGVSESVSYTASAIYGIYSASIEDHKRWIKEHLGALRGKYRGPNLWVV